MEEAIDEAKQFEKENPTHPRVDYALYMRGLALFEGQHSWYHEWFNVDLSKRPPANTEEASSVFAGGLLLKSTLNHSWYQLCCPSNNARPLIYNA